MLLVPKARGGEVPPDLHGEQWTPPAPQTTTRGEDRVVRSVPAPARSAVVAEYISYSGGGGECT